MALGKKDNSGNFKGSGELNFLGVGTYVEGIIDTKGSLRVDGKVKGSIKTVDTLTIGTTGEVSGEVSAKNLVLGGKIDGNVIVEEKLVMESKSVLIGNVKTKNLVIDEGAVFQGKSDMGIKAQAAGAPEVNKSEDKPQK
ncbi:MAG: polymer-forming cytoskeletal protein [Calditrichia bacterium]